MAIPVHLTGIYAYHRQNRTDREQQKGEVWKA
jgi:hypothetical protein